MKCRNDWGIARNTIKCENCGTDFYRPRGHAVRAKNNVCSRKCFSEFQTGAGNKMWTGGTIEKECARCGNKFTVSVRNPRGHKYCSHSCNAMARWEGRRLELKPCHHCETPFKPRTVKNKYCSPDCKNDAHAERIRGDGNGRYVHGEHERAYGPGWTLTFRQSIRDRDGNKCALCSLAQEDHGKLLCVHHIDYDKDNMSPSNLITCCRFCHGKMHGRLSERERWKKELSALLGELLQQSTSITSA